MFVLGAEFSLTPQFLAVFLLNPDPLGVGTLWEAAEEWQELGLFAQKGKGQQEFGRLEGGVVKERRNLGKCAPGEAGLARLPPSSTGFEENSGFLLPINPSGFLEVMGSSEGNILVN